jgi:hypothetical protein
MKKIISLTLLLTVFLMPFKSQADCLSKYDAAFKDKRTFFQFTNGNAQGKARLGDYAVQIPIKGAVAGLVSCVFGCLAAASLIPLAVFPVAGVAVGAAFALAIPVKMAVDGSVDLGKVRKTLRQAKEYSADQKLHNPLKKVVRRVQAENPYLSEAEIVSTIVEADLNETFCNNKLERFKNLDDLVIPQ